MSVEVPLLFFIKDDSNFSKSSGSHAKQVILIFAYTSVFFSLSTTISGFILPYMPVKLPAQMPQVSQGYESRPPLTWMELHWILSLIGATVIPIAQVLLYVWLEESNAVRITLTGIAVFALLPLTHSFISEMTSRFIIGPQNPPTYDSHEHLRTLSNTIIRYHRTF
ncbi:hypothetical protein EDB87DRAFT_1687627 [Lactarius vividus]|nr:hypothetical protein EDB87DRAFT_1687627 [Lactarius vividus]